MAKQKTDTVSNSTTQLFLDLYDITNDLIILGDGAASLVITVSAMNFGLLSEGEQDATIYAYAALLNSLSYPIQIVIRSQPKDVTAYLKKIQDLEDTATNQIYRQKIKEYHSFVESLVQDQNVLDKKFYIIIPLSAVEMGLTTQSVIPGAKSKSLSSFEKNYIIEKAKTNLIPRRDHLIDQLARIGLYSRQLTTQELIQMLYSSYNPESFEGQKVTDTANYTTPLVQAKIQGDFMIDTPTMPTSLQPTPAAQPNPTMQPAPAPSVPTPTMTETPAFTAAPATPAAPTPMSTTPEMPDFTKTDLGFATPPQMASTSPAPMSTPEVPAVPSATTPAAMPGSSVSESPTVSTPPETPMTSAVNSSTMPDPQSVIDQTLNQAGTPPIGKVGEMPSTPQPGMDN
ncbi:MAG: hypothetical protein ABI425_03295 [Patescibacteria group bacterium]